MAVEEKRGCGYRKAGGIYIRGGLDNAVPAEYMPFCLDYPFSRGLSWANSERLFRTCADEHAGGYRKFGRLALLWVGEQHYKTTDKFCAEALRMGVSRRVAFLPDGIRPGDPIAAAHIRAVPTVNGYFPIGDIVCPQDGALMTKHCNACRYVPAAKSICTCLRHLAGRAGEGEGVAGVFCLFLMWRIEVVLPESVARNPIVVEVCQKKGVTIVPVPDGDKDHVPADWKMPHFLREAILPLFDGKFPTIEAWNRSCGDAEVMG